MDIFSPIIMNEKQTSLLRFFGNTSAPSLSLASMTRDLQHLKTLRDTLRVSLSLSGGSWPKKQEVLQATNFDKPA